jgi:hypothetical protein
MKRLPDAVNSLGPVSSLMNDMLFAMKPTAAVSSDEMVTSLLTSDRACFEAVPVLYTP